MPKSVRTPGRFAAREKKRARPVRSTPAAVVCAALTLGLLTAAAPFLGTGSRVTTAQTTVPVISDRLAQRLSAILSQAAAEAETEPAASVLPLSDADLIAPEPDPDCYGTASSAAELSWLPQKAAALLEGEALYFGSDRELMPGSVIRYYLDDSIAVVTWKEVLSGDGYADTVLTFAEVKIADGSQFRRFLADGKFGADTQYTTTEMAQTVNAVLASSGDFYRFRYCGIVCYGGQVRRVNTNKADTCCINDEGDLIFLPQDTVMTEEEAQAFVDENHIRFSLTFGPILVDNYTRCEPAAYDLGEVNSHSPRAALCQLGTRHYLLVTSNSEEGYTGSLTIHQFAERIAATGCEKAYTLDGGQTAAIALDGELVNRPLYGQQRAISDIIYFATAIT